MRDLNLSQVAARIWSYSTRTLIKSIQRGTIVLNGVTSNTATITAVVTTKSQLSILGWEGDTNDGKLNPRIDLTNSTTVTANRNAGGGSITTVNFQVVEYY